MLPLKLWSGDHTVKKIGNASTLSEVVKQAQEKGVCTSENAKVFLRDWTEVEEDFFQEVIEHLLLEERIFIVTDTAPTTERTLQGHSGTQNMSSSNPEGETAALQVDFTFKVDTGSFPETVLACLRPGGPLLRPKDRRDLVQCIVGQMVAKCSRPRREFIRSVAEKVVEEFPILKDRGVDGHLLGRGYDSLFQQMENRVENMTRGKRQPSQVPDRKSKKRANVSYGCLNWQPILNSSGDAAQEKVRFLRQEGLKSAREINLPLALQYMQETYGDQRDYINSNNPVHQTREIKAQWPLLFHARFFYGHADQLLGKDVKAISEEKTALCASALANFLRDSNKKEVLYYYVQMELEESRGNRGAKEAAFLPLLAALFKDDVGQLFRVFEEGTSITERLHELPCTPTVVALGSFFQNQCYIICEQQVLFSEPTGFGEATRLAFLAYYVFNMSYPVKAATTLEFLQREIFDINPTKGTKWNGKQKCRTIVHAKIMKLAANL
ncbi:uncharacterized protein LOC144115591 [Amblyomma americanum]